MSAWGWDIRPLNMATAQEGGAGHTSYVVEAPVGCKSSDRQWHCSLYLLGAVHPREPWCGGQELLHVFTCWLQQLGTGKELAQ